MLVRLKALWAAISYRVLTTKDWLSAKSFSITGLHAAYVVAACLVALGLAYHLGKWDGSAHGLKQMAYGFIAVPAADPPKEQIALELDQCKTVANAWHDRASELEAAARQDKSTVKVAANLPPVALMPVEAKQTACKPVVRYFRPRSTTVLQDLGLAK